MTTPERDDEKQLSRDPENSSRDPLPEPVPDNPGATIDEDIDKSTSPEGSPG